MDPRVEHRHPEPWRLGARIGVVARRRARDADRRRAAGELSVLLERLRVAVVSAAGLGVVRAALGALHDLEANRSSAGALEALESEATEELELVRASEHWLLGAAAALLDDAAESEATAMAAGWARSEAREHVDRLRRRQGGLVPAPLQFARLGAQLLPPKAPSLTGIVLHDLSGRLSALGRSPATTRLEGHVSCARGLRTQALAAEALLDRANESAGAGAIRLRAVSAVLAGPAAPRGLVGGTEVPSPSELRLRAALTAPRGSAADGDLLAADIEGARRAGLELIGAVARRLDRGQAADDARANPESGAPAGTAPSDLAAARKASPRAA